MKPIIPTTSEDTKQGLCWSTCSQQKRAWKREQPPPQMIESVRGSFAPKQKKNRLLSEAKPIPSTSKTISRCRAEAEYLTADRRGWWETKRSRRAALQIIINPFQSSSRLSWSLGRTMRHRIEENKEPDTPVCYKSPWYHSATRISHADPALITTMNLTMKLGGGGGAAFILTNSAEYLMNSA